MQNINESGVKRSFLLFRGVLSLSKNAEVRFIETISRRILKIASRVYAERSECVRNDKYKRNLFRVDS